MDLEFTEKNNGGELRISGNDLAVVTGVENMPYLGMFGGADWWGNALLLSDGKDFQFSGETQKTLLSTPLNSAGRIIIEAAIRRDLQFLVDNIPGTVLDIQTRITDDNRLEIKITGKGINYYQLWNPAQPDTSSDITIDPPTLGLRIVLYPRMKARAGAFGYPSVLGYNYYIMEAAGALFVCIHGLPDAKYPSDPNEVKYQRQKEIEDGDPFSDATSDVPVHMPPQTVYYRIPYVAPSDPTGFHEDWLVSTTAGLALKFEDNEGNQAYTCPMLALAVNSQNVNEYLIFNIALELVSSTYLDATIRVIRTHTSATSSSFNNRLVSWLGIFASGTPDPSDPTNANKTIITVTPGIYTAGVTCSYGITPAFSGFYGISRQQVVFEVS